MGHVPELSCLIGSETLEEMTLPQLPSLSLCQRESLALPLLLHLLISVCRRSNLYLSVCAALLYSVTWGNWNWMPAKLQQTANGPWDTPWFSHWPDSLTCKKLFLMNADHLSEFLQLVWDVVYLPGLGLYRFFFYCIFRYWASPHAICPCMNAKATPVPTYIKVTWWNCLVSGNYWSHSRGYFVLVQAEQGRVYYQHFFTRRISHAARIRPSTFPLVNLSAD